MLSLEIRNKKLKDIKILVSKILIMILGALILAGACVSEKDFDQNKYERSDIRHKREYVSSLIDAIFLPGSNELITTTNALSQALDALDTNANATNLTVVHERFLDLIRTWKKVQAVFLPKHYDRALIDHPNLIDFYHFGKFDVNLMYNQLETIYTGTGTVSFPKNSQKSISALEYTLYIKNSGQYRIITDQQSRRIDGAKKILSSLKNYFSDIKDFYNNQQNVEKILSDPVDSVQNIVNLLVDSSYKLKDWRVGEAAGKVIKYRNNPNSARLEYHLSGHSLSAIHFILDLHKEVMEKGITRISKVSGAAKEAELAEQYIRNAKAIEFSTTLKQAIDNTDNKVDELYSALSKLHQNYYSSLVNALDLTGIIVEADGD